MRNNSTNIHVLTPKDFYVIWISNLSTMSVPGESFHYEGTW